MKLKIKDIWQEIRNSTSNRIKFINETPPAPPVDCTAAPGAPLPPIQILPNAPVHNLVGPCPQWYCGCARNTRRKCIIGLGFCTSVSIYRCLYLWGSTPELILCCFHACKSNPWIPRGQSLFWKPLGHFSSQ